MASAGDCGAGALPRKNRIRRSRLVRRKKRRDEWCPDQERPKQTDDSGDPSTLGRGAAERAYDPRQLSISFVSEGSNIAWDIIAFMTMAGPGPHFVAAARPARTAGKECRPRNNLTRSGPPSSPSLRAGLRAVRIPSREQRRPKWIRIRKEWFIQHNPGERYGVPVVRGRPADQERSSRMLWLAKECAPLRHKVRHWSVA